MFKNSSAKHYQNNKEWIQKKNSKKNSKKFRKKIKKKKNSKKAPERYQIYFRNLI